MFLYWETSQCRTVRRRREIPGTGGRFSEWIFCNWNQL